jgi:hypothetical protein
MDSRNLVAVLLAFFMIGCIIGSYMMGYNSGQGKAPEVPQDTTYKTQTSQPSNTYNLKDPTYQEMKDFLEADNTDTKPYEIDAHTCTDFSAEVNNNAEEAGIRCAAVYIIYPKTGHTIVAFNTTDKGLIFIEPQFDDEVILIIGESYAGINNYKSQQVDDTIQRYRIMW